MQQELEYYFLCIIAIEILLTALPKKLHQLPEQITGMSPLSLFMLFNLGEINIHHGV